MSIITDIFDRFLNLIFPRHCPCCDEITYDNEMICEECHEKLIKLLLQGDICKKCGLPRQECTCKRRVFLFNGITAPFRYQDEAARGVLNIKKHKSIENAEFFADFMTDNLQSTFGDVRFDIVTNVPMLPKEDREKDFNHSKILAKLVSSNINVKYENLLIQTKKRKSQHTLEYNERISNVKGIYKTKGKIDLEGKNILLVDDIKTSGASLNECAHELLLAGAEGVWCLCAAITCKKTL